MRTGKRGVEKRRAKRVAGRKRRRNKRNRRGKVWEKRRKRKGRKGVENEKSIYSRGRRTWIA